MRQPALLLVALVAFAAGPALAQKPTTAPAPSPTPPAKAVKPADQLLAAADDITRQVVALRGLSATRSFAKGVLSRDAIGKKLQARIDKEYTPSEVAIEARILKRLGLLPADADYQKMLLDLLEEQVAGFYDPFARELYIADWLGMDMQRPAMAHEIEHALQDMHFDLKKYATPIKDDGDRQLAHSALVEGDGTLVMMQFVAQAMGVDLARLADAISMLGSQLVTQSVAPQLAQAPRFLRETLLFPYVAGLSFVMALQKEKGGWAKVDAAFKNPPDSTEQVLHPAKYLAHEKPVEVTPAPVAALAPRKELRRDVLGELEWRVIFSSRLPDGTADRAAAGWGGDRLVAYASDDPNGRMALVDLSTWDTDEDTDQAEDALRAWMGRTLGAGTPAADQPGVFHKEGETWSVERRGRALLVEIGVPDDKAAATADEVWAKWKLDGKTVAASAATAHRRTAGAP